MYSRLVRASPIFHQQQVVLDYFFSASDRRGISLDRLCYTLRALYTLLTE